MNQTNLDRLTIYVAGSAVLLTIVAFIAAGPATGSGAVVGGLFATGNWYAMRWLVQRILTSNDRGKMIWGSLLTLKMSAILGVVWLILATGWVEPAGFAIGLSGLVLGGVVGGLHLSLTSDVALTDEVPAGALSEGEN